MTKNSFIKILGVLLVMGLLFAALPSGSAQAQTGTTIQVGVLDPSWTAPGGGGVYAAYYGPSNGYVPVVPGSTASFDGREAGIIKAGINIDSDGHYWDEGILAFKVNNVPTSTFAAQALSYEVQNETGGNPVWVRIRIDGNTTFQHLPESYGVGGGYHVVNAAAGQWQLMDGNGNGTGPLMTLGELATAYPLALVDRVYLTLGMGDSYHVSDGVGTVGWVDKVIIDTVTYDFVVIPTTTCTTNCYVNSATGADTFPGTADFPFKTIQQGINAVSTSGTVHVADGTYNEENILISKGITLIGAGAATTSIAPTAVTNNSTIIVNNPSGNVTISGFNFVMQPKPNYGSAVVVTGTGIAVDSATVTISNNVVTGSGDGSKSDYGFYGQNNNAKVIIENNTINNTGDNPICFEGQTGSTMVRNNVFRIVASPDYDPYFSMAYAGLTVSTPQIVEGNTFYLDHAGTGYASAITFNTAVLNDWYGTTTDSGHYTNILIKDNVIYTDGPQARGVNLADRSAGGALGTITGAVITGNQIIGENLTDVNTYGVALKGDVQSAQIQSNIINNVDIGIRIIPGNGTAPICPSGSTISSNQITSVGVSVKNECTSGSVDVTHNWWGSAAGPTAGTMVGTVSYDPWCGDAACTFLVSATEPAVSGFYVQDGKLILKGAISGTGGIDINEPLYILLKDGTVIQNSSPCFVVNSSNVTITTESIGGAKCVPTSGANGIDVASALNNITIEGIEFDGTGQTTGDGIHFAGAIQDIVVVDNYMHDLDGDGIKFAGDVSEVVNIQGNMFKANAGLGINNLGAKTVGAEYNSWGDVAGPTGTNGDGVSAKVTYEPFTHADLYLVSSGTPWANQVVKGQQITYTVMAHLVNVNAADFVLTYPAELTWVSSDASGSMGTESVLHNATARTLQFIGYNTTNLSGDLPLFTVTFTGSTAVANTPLSFSYGTTSGFGMAGYESSNNVYVNAMVNGSVTVVDLPTISSTDIQGYYLTGEQREFHVTVDNLSTGGSYAHVIFQFNVTADAGDLSIEYWTGTAWAPLPLTCASGVCSGYYGPSVGFPMPNPYTATSLFRATAAVPGAYPIEVKLLDLDADPDAVLATYTNTANVYDKALVTAASTDQYLIVGEPGAFTVTINNPTTGRNYNDSVVFDIVIPSHAVTDFSALSCSITSPVPFTWNLLPSLVPDGAGGVKARIVGLDGYFEVPPSGVDMVLNCSVTVTTAGTYSASGRMVDVVDKVTPVERIVSDSVGLSTVAYAKPVITPTNLDGPFVAGVTETVSLSIANTSIPEPFEVVFNFPEGTVVTYGATSIVCTAAGSPPISVDLTAEPTVLEFSVTFDESWTGDVSVSLYDSDWTPSDRLLASASETGVQVSGDFAVTGTFSMQGNASRAGIPVTLTWGGTLATYGPSATTSAAISNNFSLTVLYGGEYTITTLQPRYLNVTADLLKKITLSGPYNMTALILKGGNAYWKSSLTALDNVINTSDASLVGGQYGTPGTETDYGNHGDCNFDGIVNIQDLALVGGNWSLTSATAYSGTLPWVP